MLAEFDSVAARVAQVARAAMSHPAWPEGRRSVVVIVAEVGDPRNVSDAELRHLDLHGVDVVWAWPWQCGVAAGNIFAADPGRLLTPGI